MGIIGWIAPRSLGAGYDNLRSMLDGRLAFVALLTLGVFKFLSWALCLGSGTSGGTVAHDVHAALMRRRRNARSAALLVVWWPLAYTGCPNSGICLWGSPCWWE